LAPNQLQAGSATISSASAQRRTASIQRLEAGKRIDINVIDPRRRPVRASPCPKVL
jgi:cytosine/adenosine deaminase-related metal-dependent hydrolase